MSSTSERIAMYPRIRARFPFMTAEDWIFFDNYTIRPKYYTSNTFHFGYGELCLHLLEERCYRFHLLVTKMKKQRLSITKAEDIFMALMDELKDRQKESALINLCDDFM